jgi:metal-sulfur cluster biosynthetic enzyme
VQVFSPRRPKGAVEPDLESSKSSIGSHRNITFMHHSPIGGQEMSESNSNIPALPVTTDDTCQSTSHEAAQSASGCCGGSTTCTSAQPPVAVTSLCEDSVREQLKQVIDPELFVNIVDLGLVYTVDLVPSETDADKQEVRVEMTLTSPMCPAGPQLVSNSRQVIEAMPGVSSADIKVVMDPPWTPDKMSEDARDQLNIF